MHRTIGDSFGTSAGKRIFRQENLPSYEATQVTYDSMNALQEEIATAIEGAGITLNPTSEAVADMTQLNDAILARVNAEAVVRDANDKVLDGTLARSQINAFNAQGLASTTMVRTQWQQSSLAPNGLTLSVVDPVPIVSTYISVGNTRAVNGDAFMIVNAMLSKRIDGAWSVGSGVGGRAGALSNATWYHVFVIKSAAGVIDAGYDTSETAANLLVASGYSYYKRVGSVYYINNANGIRPFLVRGNITLWTPAIVDQSGMLISVAPAVTSVGGLSVPSVYGVTALINFSAVHASAAWQVNVRDGILGAAYDAVSGCSVAGAAAQRACGEMHLLTDNATIYVSEVVAGSPSAITINTRGYIDERLNF